VKYLDETPSAGERLCLHPTEEDVVRSDAYGVGVMEAEFYAMSIPFGELLPGLDRMMTHGVAVSCDGRSFIFTAESGVGKSTHAFLWQKYLGEDRVRVINGDKPVLWFREDGAVLACGTPWSGKEGLDENVCLPLGGICLLRRLEDAPEGGPRITEAPQDEAFDFLMHQVYMPRSAAGRLKTLQLMERLYRQVPVYHLYTDMSREGVMVSSGCLLGRR